MKKELVLKKYIKNQNLPKLKKIQIANNWKNGEELVRALNAISGKMGDSIESLTLFTNH